MQRNGFASTVNPIQIDLNILCIQLADGAQKMRYRCGASYCQRLCKMRPVPENLANHAAARIARADLDKRVHAGRVGGANHAWKINRALRLRLDGVSG